MATVLGSKQGRRGYLQQVGLGDGTLVNVVTRLTGPGLAADTELECGRELNEDEQEEACDAAAGHDVTTGPAIKRPDRFPVVAAY